MSYLEVPPFDVLSEDDRPYTGFGPVLNESKQVEDRFGSVVSEAKHRLGEYFHVVADPSRVADQLETIVGQMWGQGWDPDKSNVGLFATDFGSLLTDAIHRTLKCQLIFRSATDLSHVSCWWAARRVEAFPFHKVYKRLLYPDGESLTHFVEGLRYLLGSPKIC